MNRRQTLLGLSAIGIAAATPVLASTPVVAFDPIMANVRRSLEWTMARDPAHAEIGIALNERFLRRYGVEFFGDRYMRGPVDLFEGRPLAAMTRKLSVRYESGEFHAGDYLDGRAREILIDGIVDEIAAEFRGCSEVLHPYVPITSSGVLIDPRINRPVMTFMTRVGMTVA